jgi:hypothetical protein
MEAVPDLDGSWALVAVTVTFAAEEGAVKRPVAEMAPPPVTDQVTAELKLPVPWTFAVHCAVAPVAMVEGEQLGATDDMAGEEAWGGAALAVAPQEITHERTGQASRTQRRRIFKEFLRLQLGHLQAGL